jgi:hypothetical protein
MASPQTNTAERVGVPQSDEPAAANEDPKPAPLSLKARMAAIREDAFGIGKDNIKMKSKAGVEFTIRGHTVEAVLSEMRPLFAKHGVDVTPNLVERTYSGNRCDILVDFTFERTDDSDESRVVRWAGAGTDDGDKGFSKAGTNALKEMLKKVFLITDRDDAKEEEDKVEHKPEGAIAAVEAAKERAADSVVGWAATFKAALEKCRTKKEVGRLQAENAQRLTSPELPAVTKSFFNDLIDRLKRELPDQ